MKKKFLIIFSVLFFILVFNSCKKNPPSPDFNIIGNGGVAPCEIKFENTSTDATSFHWKFGDGENSLSDEKDPKHTYNNAGEYTVTLYATGKGGTNSKSKTVLISQSLPTPNFTFIINGETAPCTVTFTNTSTNADSYEWQFGDNTTSNEKNPTHEYSAGGNYTIMLTAINTKGQQQISKTITIANQLTIPSPVANFTYSGNGTAPCTVTFTNTSTNANSYVWNFGDGSPTETATNPTHHYTTGGQFSVILTATNSETGESNEKEKIVVIQTEANPVANFTISGAGYDVFAPATVSFTSTSTNAVTYEWNFGDPASGALNTSTEPNPEHLYSTHGDFTVELTVKNSAGVPNVIQKTLHLKKRPDRLKITKITIMNMPLTNGGSNWDTDLGFIQPNAKYPDPFIVVYDVSQNVLAPTPTIWRKDVNTLPVEAYIMSPNLEINTINAVYTFKILDDDSINTTPTTGSLSSSEEIGYVLFNFNTYTTGENAYPTVITRSTNGIELKLDVIWE